MDSDPYESERTRQVFREFALACRTERDRLAIARLEREDQRFETALADRIAAQLLAMGAIRAAQR
jgi:hypothetical protein